ncbi:MAG: class I SAM-dependent methyltransferase [Planctomycetes bacterium]|nr:class I SAM-dependent methyltransferase [Planctomycetota bacterium]
MKTNRILSREQAQSLDLDERVALEARVTDRLVAENARPPQIGPDWTIDDYTNRALWLRRLHDWFGPLEGRSILDLGCGHNPTPLYFALAGARRVAACDVSPKALACVAAVASEFKVTDRVSIHQTPAERLPFDDASFDLVHGLGVLHHLDLERAAPEIARVLKPGGRGGFVDPLGHNLLLEFARDYLPYRWKHSVKGTDRPLRYADIRRFGRHFDSCHWEGMGFLWIPVAWMFGRGRSRMTRMADAVDTCLLSVLPFLRRYCRCVVTCVEKAPADPPWPPLTKGGSGEGRPAGETE